MTKWTKADIDELVEELRDRGWGAGASGVSLLRRDAYLAAGLTAEGEPKPEKVRGWIYWQGDKGPWICVGDPSQYSSRCIPGTFVPDGAE